MGHPFFIKRTSLDEQNREHAYAVLGLLELVEARSTAPSFGPAGAPSPGLCRMMVRRHPSTFPSRPSVAGAPSSIFPELQALSRRAESASVQTLRGVVIGGPPDCSVLPVAPAHHRTLCMHH